MTLFNLRIYAPSILTALALFLSGCGGDDVETYRIPKEISRAETEHPAMAESPQMDTPGAPSLAATTMETGYSWEFPDTWTPRSGTNTMRLASYETPAGSDFSIVRLPDSSDLSNVNRWLAQLGRDPIGDGELSQVTEHLTVGGRHAHLFFLDGPYTTDRAILAGIIREGDQAWFYKLDGPRNDVINQRQNMMAVMGSMTAGGPLATSASPAGYGEQPSSPVPSAPMASGNMRVLPGMEEQVSGIPDATWSAPKSWVEISGSPVRKATYQIASGAVELAITAFPGDVGGLLANINRWRGQLGLPPASATELGDLTESLEIDGYTGTLLYFASGEESDSVGVLGLIVELDQATWFFKMTGPADLLLKEQPRFKNFTRTLSFASGSSS